MLPEELSNDLCSLRPRKNRASLAVAMRFDSQGRKLDHRFMRALIRSAARLIGAAGPCTPTACSGLAVSRVRRPRRGRGAGPERSGVAVKPGG
jgi:hypothetical protein